MISDYEEVVIRFKAYRISYPLTQKELSDKSGVSLRSITRFESGEDISLVNFMKLMNAMELMNNFVNVIPDMNNRPSSYLKNVKTRQRACAKRKADTGFKWAKDGDKTNHELRIVEVEFKENLNR
jgi:transcriptional regulator with XRE-family HTH domain